MSWITSLNFSSLDCEMGSRAGLSLMVFAKILWSKYPYLNLSQSCLKSLMKWPGLKILKQETLRCLYKFQLTPKCWQMLLTLPLGSSPPSYLEPQSPLEDRNLSVESREWAGTWRERWGVLSQGERVCRPGPIPGLGIKENSYPFFVIRVKNVLCPGTHYFLPIFLCLTLLAWQRPLVDLVSLKATALGQPDSDLVPKSATWSVSSISHCVFSPSSAVGGLLFKEGTILMAIWVQTFSSFDSFP